MFVLIVKNSSILNSTAPTQDVRHCDMIPLTLLFKVRERRGTRCFQSIPSILAGCPSLGVLDCFSHAQNVPRDMHVVINTRGQSTGTPKMGKLLRNGIKYKYRTGAVASILLGETMITRTRCISCWTSSSTRRS